MSTFKNLSELVKTVNAYKGSWMGEQLALDALMFLWEKYEPDDLHTYPCIPNWSDLLEKAIDTKSYDRLNKDEVLSVLFGLHHRSRIIDGLWWSMFERGATQKLLERLLVLDTDKH